MKGKGEVLPPNTPMENLFNNQRLRRYFSASQQDLWSEIYIINLSTASPFRSMHMTPIETLCSMSHKQTNKQTHLNSQPFSSSPAANCSRFVRVQRGVSIFIIADADWSSMFRASTTGQPPMKNLDRNLSSRRRLSQEQSLFANKKA